MLSPTRSRVTQNSALSTQDFVLHCFLLSGLLRHFTRLELLELLLGLHVAGLVAQRGEARVERGVGNLLGQISDCTEISDDLAESASLCADSMSVFSSVISAASWFFFWISTRLRSS